MVSLPSGSFSSALRGEMALQCWYHDTTIRAFDIDQVGKNPIGIYFLHDTAHYFDEKTTYMLRIGAHESEKDDRPGAPVVTLIRGIGHIIP